MMEDYKNEIEMLRQAFTDGKSDREIEMPDAEAELEAFVAAHRDMLEHKTVRMHFLGKIAALFVGIVMLSGLTYAAVRTNFFTRSWNGERRVERVAGDKVPARLLILPNDTVQKPVGVITFDNHELVEILTSICNAYGVKIQFKNEEQKHIRLHFSYDTEDKLEEVMESLNTFEKFRLELKDKKMIVK